MGFFGDMVKVFKKRDLAFIESREVCEGVYSFSFEKGEDIAWEAGQHGLFTLTHKKISGGTKPFTVISLPSDNVIQIAMRIGDNPSEFKKGMLELKRGMTVKISGPVGPFTFKDSQPALFIAGGIGITPFLAMLKQVERDGNAKDKPIRLLYVDSRKQFPFKETLDAMASRQTVDVIYLESSEDLNLEIDKFADIHKNNGAYFVAGPKPIVDATSAYLQKKQISGGQIKKDAFWGYNSL